MGGVAAAAGLRGPEGPGDGGETRRRIFQEAVAGFEQPGYPFRATLYGFYDFTRLQWMLVERLLSSGLLDEVYFPGSLRRRGESSSFVPVRRQGVGSAARGLRGKRGVPGRRPIRRDRVRAGEDLLPRAARGSSTRPVPGPLRSPRGRGDAPRRPQGPVLAGRRSARLRRPRREEGDPGNGGRLGTDRRGVRHRDGGAPRRSPLFRSPRAPPSADDRGRSGRLPAPGGDRRPLVPVSPFRRWGGRRRRAARPVGPSLEGAPGRLRVRLGNAPRPAPAETPSGGGCRDGGGRPRGAARPPPVRGARVAGLPAPHRGGARIRRLRPGGALPSRPRVPGRSGRHPGGGARPPGGGVALRDPRRPRGDPRPRGSVAGSAGGRGGIFRPSSPRSGSSSASAEGCASPERSSSGTPSSCGACRRTGRSSCR